MTQADTIAAIATPPGTGGIGIVRASGPGAERIGRALFRPSKTSEPLLSHRLSHGKIVCPTTGRVLDEVLLVFMRAPRSFTGEDTLEIHCHGGPLILEEVLTAVLRAGARPAEPGEFTRRAFLNGRLDLAQAEAVQEMITARSQRGLDLALGHLRGDLSRSIGELRAALLDVLALLEAEIDFQEEDGVEASPRDALLDRLRDIAARIGGLTASYGEGRMAREGARVVITGKANVGKSSLFNRLLGEDRAIVTPHAGTTRDFIEFGFEPEFIGRLPVRVICQPLTVDDLHPFGRLSPEREEALPVALHEDGLFGGVGGDGDRACEVRRLGEHLALFAGAPGGLPPGLLLHGRGHGHADGAHAGERESSWEGRFSCHGVQPPSGWPAGPVRCEKPGASGGGGARPGLRLRRRDAG